MARTVRVIGYIIIVLGFLGAGPSIGTIMEGSWSGGMFSPVLWAAADSLGLLLAGFAIVMMEEK